MDFGKTPYVIFVDTLINTKYRARVFRINHRTMNFATDFGKETDIIISRIEAKTTIPAHNNKNLSSDDEFCDGFWQSERR